MFLAKINLAQKKPAILKITPPYAEEFIPNCYKSTLPKPMTDLYNPEMLHVDFITLLNECETVFSSLKV